MKGLKPLVFVLLLLPAGYGLWLGLQGGLGPDPGAELADFTGIWALRLLLVVIFMSAVPASLLGRSIMGLRRMLGLFCFFYASLHLLVFLAVLLGWDFDSLWLEIRERPYVTLGFSAWCLLLPLALTSTDRAVRRLRRRWKVLHRLVYPCLILVLVHFVWVVRDDLGEFYLYAGIALLLVGLRLKRVLRRQYRVAGSAEGG